ncbi:hypothetical protein ALC56_04518 [Trachymyrmex septentrionalis]|uniref:Uncharacterized protein n=1 Tax=Trachymyrmex septentrionalis TaxID=34720 RepID=A0A195FM13_9HYME|nr:hypothetical protein ALC56_04518 [Trachymyrmex septentrionalis]
MKCHKLYYSLDESGQWSFMNASRSTYQAIGARPSSRPFFRSFERGTVGEPVVGGAPGPLRRCCTYIYVGVYIRLYAVSMYTHV